MQFIKQLKRLFTKKSNLTHMTETDYIYHKIPALILLNGRQPVSKLNSEGNIPICLTKGTIAHFSIIPQANQITGIRLRLGTYCRTNHSHLTIKIDNFIQHFSVNQIVDNQYTDFTFSTSYSCISGKPINISIYSEDANENNAIALWCSDKYLPFHDQLNFKLLHLPAVSNPRVSIIIPIFNNVLYTYNCLLSLQQCDQHIAQEIILVDNASTDETEQLLSHLTSQCKIVQNQENTGFVQACRQGAELATGEFIILLNNDTQVTPNWLKNLLNIMQQHPKVGIVGSKLIYPDGRLQEAGGIIFNDASGWNYGRFQSPTHNLYNQDRPVDYCSGASLMIRRDLWQHIGGFDLRYAPAYYEDTDLCFAVRQAGYQVIYCHNSIVVHYEGITAGTDVSSGYKRYQLINQQKFQQKWQTVLNTHYPPPPHCSPDAAAFRLATDKLTFRLPQQKIIATHFLAEGWAPNFWSYLNIHQIDEELNFIQSLNFNTIILLVPWVGFQTSIEPICYYEPYFELFDQLLAKIQKTGLQVILRIGYTHDNGPVSTPEGYLRQVVIAEDKPTLVAWCDYLDKLWQISKKYNNLLGGFITWEDFFFMDLTHIPFAARLEYAQKTGYQRYLEKNYSLADISQKYGQQFLFYQDVPIPAFKGQGIHLFCEFWDHVLIYTIFTTTQRHFPLLSMEVRMDCDPEGEQGIHICHDKTFDLTENSHISMIYYSPAWGSPNQGQPESAQAILTRMQFMFDHIRAHTQNSIFIDQFNFIDNTPGFEHNTGILPSELPDFLDNVSTVLQNNTIGYSLWTLRDVPANLLRNGLFIHHYPSWEMEQGHVTFDANSQKQMVCLHHNGQLIQLVIQSFGVPLVKNQPFQLNFKIKAEELTEIEVSVIRDDVAVFQKKISVKTNEWHTQSLEQVPFNIGCRLQIINLGKSDVYLSHFYLYQICQENGIIDAKGQVKSFYPNLVNLNKKLKATYQVELKSFLDKSELVTQRLHGLYSDLWMGAQLLGKLAILQTEQTEIYFLVKVYVPDHWENYTNKLTLMVNEQKIGNEYHINAGYQEIHWAMPNQFVASWVTFQLQAEKIYSIKQYDGQSQDNRAVSMQIIGLGFSLS